MAGGTESAALAAFADHFFGADEALRDYAAQCAPAWPCPPPPSTQLPPARPAHRHLRVAQGTQTVYPPPTTAGPARRRMRMGRALMTWRRRCLASSPLAATPLPCSWRRTSCGRYCGTPPPSTATPGCRRPRSGPPRRSTLQQQQGLTGSDAMTEPHGPLDLQPSGACSSYLQHT